MICLVGWFEKPGEQEGDNSSANILLNASTRSGAWLATQMRRFLEVHN
jgi:hypothetical protein